MMKSESLDKRQSIRQLFLLFIGLFSLLFILLTTVVILPKFANTITELLAEANKATLFAEAHDIKFFMSGYEKSLRAVSQHPSVVSAALLAETDNLDLIEYLNTVSLLGDKVAIGMYDYAGEPLYFTRQAQAPHKARFQKLAHIIKEKEDFDFILEEIQDGTLVDMGVPVYYGGHMEGILVAEIPFDIHQVFKEYLANKDHSIIVEHNGVKIRSQHTKIVDAVTHHQLIEPYDIHITLLMDSKVTKRRERQLFNDVVLSMGIGLICAILLLGGLGYRIMVQPYIALEKAHEQLLILQKAVENMNDLFIVTKADNLEEGPEIIYVNPAVRHLSGYTSDELLGKTPRIFQGPLTNYNTLKDIKSALHEGKGISVEIINYNKEREPYWVQLSIIPIYHANGSLLYFAALERDITERKRYEQELVEAKKEAERASQIKTEFLANMSHELRTPMNGVLTSVEFLADEPLTPEQLDTVDIIYRSGRHLLNILNNILDISKVESGDIELELKPMSLSLIIQEIILVFTPVAEKKSITLQVTVSDDVPKVVIGDKLRLSQVLHNLIGNALKFTPDKGSVFIDVKYDESNNNGEAYFGVKDTGIGISQDKREKIFDKFSQADSATTRKYGGTGLGLAISQQLIQIMGGRIKVDSELHHGSLFYFKIPLPTTSDEINTTHKKKKSYCPHDNPNDLIELNKAHILLVEDYPINVKLVSKQLHKIGIEKIDTATNGLEAVEMVQKQEYDIVLMDCQMPEMDGYQATEEIRKQEQDTGKHVYIIAMTANAMVGDREKCLQAGMDEYVSKPIKQSELERIIRTTLSL